MTQHPPQGNQPDDRPPYSGPQQSGPYYGQQPPQQAGPYYGQQPPQQGAFYPAGPTVAIPRKKHTARNVLLIVVALLVVLCGGIVIAAAVNGGGKSGTSTNGGTSGTKPAGKAAAGLNTPVRDGKFEFVVKSVTCGKPTEGDSALGKQAQGQFCELAVSVKNIGNKPQTFSGSSQKARGSTGATYADDTEAELYANQNAQTFLQDINPGNQVAGVLVFDIPKDAKITSVELHDSPFSGGVTVTVG